MNDKYSTTAKAEKLSNEKRLEKQWKNIDWKRLKMKLIGCKSGLLRQLKKINGIKSKGFSIL